MRDYGHTCPLVPRQHPRQEELRSPLHPLCQALGHTGSSLQNLRYGACPWVLGGHLCLSLLKGC